ncbi:MULTISPECIES: heavy-metal-associated domain-containing protein [Bizionia]|uniref:Heavy-metal-associated domain-containing protein n=1 Tax=Bizionia algoritergicola TaxID=291187 RepID=A0A5D0R2A9_9FLAO|nr:MULTISPECIES: heavy metal-associated domain-containing protein [Bizionia]OBX22448.1 heavy metal transporter [Bizionia sp. APA-3]TYB74654.1 heavy-metal-associated domain-containing protein [Bizionia algoritergicola]
MEITLEIQNLKCVGCAHTISTKLAGIAGIENILVAVESNEVSFDYASEADLVVAKQKLKSIGYPEIDTANSVVTKAQSFISCATGKMANHES